VLLFIYLVDCSPEEIDHYSGISSSNVLRVNLRGGEGGGGPAAGGDKNIFIALLMHKLTKGWSRVPILRSIGWGHYAPLLMAPYPPSHMYIDLPIYHKIVKVQNFKRISRILNYLGF
jgi:hypothetical protein